MRRFGIVGFPLGHSFSKRYFTDKFERDGLIDCVYDSFPLATIDELDGIIRQYPDLCGLNVTIPYKFAVMKFITENRVPGQVGAANCIKINGGNIIGYNTDILGFEQSFIPLLTNAHKKALVLGNGGATAAVKFVLSRLGIAYQVVSRKQQNESTLTYQALNEDLLQDFQIIINATPLGTFPDVNSCPPIPYEYVTSNHYLYDLVYNPAKSLFLTKGEERGASISNGYNMLVIQAEESWKIWNSTAT